LIAEAGHGTKALRTDVFLDVPMLLPPNREQVAIRDVLREAKADLDRSVSCLEQSIDAMTEFRSALVTAAVTGQLPEFNS
jgi:type I restriction enzyme S subunit